VSAAALLSELRRRDIQVRVVGSELRCSAPAGTLTPELRAELQRHKNDVLELLSSAQALAAQARALVPLERGGSRAPIYGVPGHNGDVFCYRALSRALGAEQPFFGLQPPGLDGERAPLTRVEHLAGYFAAQIRARARRGRHRRRLLRWRHGTSLRTSWRAAPRRFLAPFGCPTRCTHAPAQSGTASRGSSSALPARRLAAQSSLKAAPARGARRAARADAERRAADPVSPAAGRARTVAGCAATGRA
jgi:hypothetical protein